MQEFWLSWLLQANIYSAEGPCSTATRVSRTENVPRIQPIQNKYMPTFLAIIIIIMTSITSEFIMWVFRFSRRRIWRWLSSRFLRSVIWQKFTNVSEVFAASIIRPWNVVKSLPDYTAQQPRRQPSSEFIMFLWLILCRKIHVGLYCISSLLF
jgi:hypothetical protein